MNKDNAKDYLPLVQALAEGKQIQSQLDKHLKWRDTNSPDFSMAPDQYRIKPEPREIWVNEYPFSDSVVHYTEAMANDRRRADGVTRRYREVIE